MDHFAQAGRAGISPPFAEVLDKLIAQSRAFLELGQQLADNDGVDWQESVSHYLDKLASGLRDPVTAAAQTGMPALDYWHRFAGHGDGDAGESRSFLDQLDQLLRTPGLGYTREQQETIQELSRRWIAYEEAHGEYLAYCAETIRIAVLRLRGCLTEQFKAGQGPGSVRELYDAWVSCCEEVHGERAASEEYMKRYGRMVNALMAYRQHISRVVDQLAEAVNLPNRAEVDAVHRKIKDLQQEVRELKARLDRETTADRQP